MHGGNTAYVTNPWSDCKERKNQVCLSICQDSALIKSHKKLNSQHRTH